MTTDKRIEYRDFSEPKNFAEFYELDFVKNFHEDIAFYLALIKPNFKEVLELCCGTGRVSIPLAKNNIKVSALDISNEMLSVFTDKIKDLDKEISERITLIKADMTNFLLKKKYDCILISYHSFQCLTDSLQVSQALITISKHLTDNGYLIFNLFKPLEEMKQIEGASESKTVKNKEGEIIYIVKSTNTFIDALNQIVYFDLQYCPFGDINKSIVENLKVKFYYLNQITELLEGHNFYIEHQYQGFNTNLISDNKSSELTFVCRKKMN